MRQLLIDTQSSSEKILDKSINQSLDTSLHIRCDKIMIYGSNLKHENRKLLSLTATKHKLKILTAYRYSFSFLYLKYNKISMYSNLYFNFIFQIICYICHSGGE